MQILGEKSKAEEYVQQKAWAYRLNDSGQMNLEICPMSGCTNFHFYIRHGGENDGQWDCKKCGLAGNLWQLKDKFNDNKPSVLESQKDWAAKQREKDPLPNPDTCHTRLLEDDVALEYLTETRGFSIETIKKLKLGVADSGGKKWIVIPYFNHGQLQFAKYRRVPPMLESDKRFHAPKGYDVPLFNEECLVENMEFVIFTEGEMDAISVLDMGIDQIVGVPGKDMKKADWIIKLDNAKPKRIYTLYDNSQDSQDAAAELAKRIALNTELPPVLNIKLPPFEKEDGTPGKDVNEWRKAGHTKKEFLELMEKAVPFEVRGMVSIGGALDRMEQQFEGKEELRPTYEYEWDDLNRKAGGFEPGDVIDIIAPEKIGKTTFALNVLDYLVGRYEENGWLWCLEMPVERMARKWVSKVTHTDDSPARDPEDAKQKMVAMRAALSMAKDIINARKAELFLSEYTPQDADEIFEIIKQAVRRYGIKFLVFDNMQLACDVTLRRADHRTIHMSQISKKFKALAKALGIVIFRIIQPRGVKPGEIPDHRSADGSSQLSKDCDCTLALFRNQRVQLNAEEFQQIGFLDEEIAMEPEMLTRASISRYAGGGVCTLIMEGQYSTVRGLTPEERGGKKKPQSDGMRTIALPKEEVVEA